MKKNNIIPVIITIVVMVLVLMSIGIFYSVYKDIRGDKKSNDWEELINSKEEKVLYFGRKGCTWCVKYKPILETLKTKYGVEYEYIDTDIVSGFDELLAKLGKDYNTFSTPYTVVVKKGKKISELSGYADIKSVFEFYKQNGLIDKDTEYEEIEINEEEIIIESNKENYPNLNILNYNDYTAVLNNLKKNIIVVGQTTCGYCSEYKETLNVIAAEKNITINYIDIDNLNQANYDAFNESLDFFKNTKDWGTPLTLIVENKTVIDYIEGIKSKNDTISYYESLGLIK